MIAVNMLISWKSEEKEIVERVLWLVKAEDRAFVINVDSHECPYIRKISDISEALQKGKADELAADPYMRLVTEEQLTEKEKEGRQNAWQIIKDLVYAEPQIYLPKERGKLIREVSQRFNTNNKTIYSYLKRYWTRGKNPNALLPDLYLCGRRGVEKANSSVKRGRPRSLEAGQGINVTEDIRQIFRVAIKKYYYTSAQYSIRLTYELMLKEFFAESVKYENGIRIPVIKPIQELPTYDQFYYWFRKERNIKAEISSRISAKRYEQQYRPIIGNSTAEALGPGSIYQIDSTVADVYLCSSINRNWIVGRPCVYAVIDVYSRMIVGLYCGFEGPSWAGAMNALANCATDKISFCAEYGIQITEDEWPIHFLPEGIIADRGEMEGRNAENIIEGLGLKILNTPPYRADWKGIIEQNFRISNLRAKPFLPGMVLNGTNVRERGSKDYRLDAKLDIYQFTQIMIRCILFHNNQHHLKNYHKDIGMIQDEVLMIPSEIWKWGIANRGGKLRSMNEDLVKLHLMPSAEATATARGIRFKGIFYTSKKCLKERWFEKARQGTWRVNIAYDPRNMDYIYLKGEDSKSFDKCTILEYQIAYKNKCIEEIEYLHEEERLKKSSIQQQELQGKVDLISQIENIVKDAETEHKKEFPSKESNTARLKGIRDKKAMEKAVNRENEAFELDKRVKEQPAEVLPLPNNPHNSAKDDTGNYDFLLELQREAMKKVYE